MSFELLCITNQMCFLQSQVPLPLLPTSSFSSDLLHLIRFHCCCFLGVRSVAATVFPLGIAPTRLVSLEFESILHRLFWRWAVVWYVSMLWGGFCLWRVRIVQGQHHGSGVSSHGPYHRVWQGQCAFNEWMPQAWPQRINVELALATRHLGTPPSLTNQQFGTTHLQSILSDFCYADSNQVKKTEYLVSENRQIADQNQTNNLLANPHG